MRALVRWYLHARSFGKSPRVAWRYAREAQAKFGDLFSPDHGATEQDRADFDDRRAW